ncbi:RNA polymerase sigma factor [Aliirhizobium terrae]|uniref:RNA polymerase sigma factor n=1 Tax=Terrirhizobium terrae TaxID=2926709 RepID=UPI002579081C|nr:RNA polymerase sigma factor [Rhizobium sp. CC-CFT758]WJH41098.1 RNA polymerase sigma factor [Rhizobium sp. CC-CFT758]
MQTAYSAEIVSTFLGLRKVLLSTIARMVKSPTTAEDLVQDTFLRLWERQADLRNRPLQPGYIVRIGRNLAIDFKRRERIAPFVGGIEDLQFIKDPTPTPEDHTIASENLRVISDAITSLPPRAREVFVMARIDGLTYVEIGKRLGISPKTVFSHMVVALERLDQAHQSAR